MIPPDANDQAQPTMMMAKMNANKARFIAASFYGKRAGERNQHFSLLLGEVGLSKSPCYRNRFSTRAANRTVRRSSTFATCRSPAALPDVTGFENMMPRANS